MPTKNVYMPDKIHARLYDQGEKLFSDIIENKRVSKSILLMIKVALPLIEANPEKYADLIKALIED